MFVVALLLWCCFLWYVVKQITFIWIGGWWPQFISFFHNGVSHVDVCSFMGGVGMLSLTFLPSFHVHLPTSSVQNCIYIRRARRPCCPPPCALCPEIQIQFQFCFFCPNPFPDLDWNWWMHSGMTPTLMDTYYDLYISCCCTLVYKFYFQFHWIAEWMISNNKPKCVLCVAPIIRHHKWCIYRRRYYYHLTNRHIHRRIHLRMHYCDEGAASRAAPFARPLPRFLGTCLFPHRCWSFSHFFPENVIFLKLGN